MIFFKATSDISFSENYLIACNVQEVFLQENNNINNNALPFFTWHPLKTCFWLQKWSASHSKVTIRLIRMAAVITPDSFAVTTEYCSMACNGLTGFFAKVFMTDIVSLLEITQMPAIKMLCLEWHWETSIRTHFSSFKLVTSPNGIYSCVEGSSGGDRGLCKNKGGQRP